MMNKVQNLINIWTYISKYSANPQKLTRFPNWIRSSYSDAKIKNTRNRHKRPSIAKLKCINQISALLIKKIKT